MTSKLEYLKGLQKKSSGVKFQMSFSICLFFIFSSYFIKDTSGMNPFNGNKDSDLPPDFIRKWEDSQVFIYYKTKFAQKFSLEYPYPDCFGNLITADYVITATSCFIDLKKLVKRLRDREIDGFYSPQGKPLKVMKSDISKITIAKVCFVVNTYNTCKVNYLS